MEPAGVAVVAGGEEGGAHGRGGEDGECGWEVAVLEER